MGPVAGAFPCGDKNAPIFLEYGGVLWADETGLEIRLFQDVAFQLANGQTDLLHGIPVPHGDGLVLQGIEVDGDAQRRADLVLPAVALADLAGVLT